MTTTIRVDEHTHETLLALSRAAGTTLLQTARDAAEALRRLHFSHQVAEEIAALKQDPAAWEDYLNEAEATSVRDGLG